MKAFIFPGQGAQFTGMGKDIYESNAKAKSLFDEANKILGFDISQIMFTGSAEALKQTAVTQPRLSASTSIFLYNLSYLSFSISS